MRFSIERIYSHKEPCSQSCAHYLGQRFEAGSQGWQLHYLASLCGVDGLSKKEEDIASNKEDEEEDEKEEECNAVFNGIEKRISIHIHADRKGK